MKILFFPAPAHGHVNPMLPLARELVSRGDEVLFYVTPEFEAVVRATGASVRFLDKALSIREDLSGPGGSPPGFQQILPELFGLMSLGLREAPRMAEQARAEKADGVVYDPMALWGRAIAHLLGLPAAIFQTSFAMSSPWIQREMKKTFNGRPPLAALRPLLQMQWNSLMLELRHGVPRLGMKGMFALAEGLNIIPVPRSYQPDAELFDARHLFVGPSVAPRGDHGDFPLEQLDGKPVLFISLGTSPMNQQPDFYKACFEAFRDTRWQVVMACGKHLEPARLGPTPSNFIVRKRVPQVEILFKARVFLTHGGMNSTMEGLWHGVPLAVFPQFGDQPINAARVTAMGLGATLTRQDALTPQVLRETVERLDTDPGYRTRMAGFQKELQEAGGQRRAADALQAYVAARQGTSRRAA